jgi:hypothetical protein
MKLLFLFPFVLPSVHVYFGSYVLSECYLLLFYFLLATISWIDPSFYSVLHHITVIKNNLTFATESCVTLKARMVPSNLSSAMITITYTRLNSSVMVSTVRYSKPK